MISAIALLCLVAPAPFVTAADLVLEMRHQQNGQETENWQVPTKLDQLVAKGWGQYEKPPFVPVNCTLARRPEAATLDLLFDANENLIGVVNCVIKSTVSELKLDPTVQGFSEWTTEIDGADVLYLCNYALFGPCDLSSWPAERDSSSVVQGDVVCVSGYGGEPTEIPTKLSDATELAKNKCVPKQGYYYFGKKINSEMECTAENINPWFVTGDEAGQMNGGGWFWPGLRTFDDDTFHFGLNFNSTDVEKTMSDYPQCLYDLGNFIGGQLWFSSSQDITCDAA